MTKDDLKKAIEKAIQIVTGKKNKERTTAAVYGDVVTTGDTNAINNESTPSDSK